MDPETLEALKSLIVESLKPVQTNLQTYVDTAIKTAIEPVQAAIAKPEPEAKPEDMTLKQRLAMLEKNLAEKEKAEAQQRFTNALGESVDSFKPKYRKEVIDYLQPKLKDAVEKDGVYYLPDGKRLDEAVKDFFSSDYGRHHLASDHKDGAGTPKPEPTPQADFQDVVSAFL